MEWARLRVPAPSLQTPLTECMQVNMEKKPNSRKSRKRFLRQRLPHLASHKSIFSSHLNILYSCLIFLYVGVKVGYFCTWICQKRIMYSGVFFVCAPVSVGLICVPSAPESWVLVCVRTVCFFSNFVM
jgi:hypothetical protein